MAHCWSGILKPPPLPCPIALTGCFAVQNIGEVSVGRRGSKMPAMEEFKTDEATFQSSPSAHRR